LRGRNLLALALCLAALGCQPPSYRIVAQQDRYRLLFTAREGAAWPPGTDVPIEARRLTVRDGNRYVWAIERDEQQAGCSQSGSPPFPVAYGSSLPCYRTLVEPQPIARTTLYRVDGAGMRHGIGFFRYEPFAGGGRATNLEWEDVAAEVRNWPVLPDPRAADQSRKKANAAPAAAETNAVSANNP